MNEQVGPQPLSDLRVLDFTHGIAGPYCTKLLGDFGADVIKIERPGTGDFSRNLGPFPDDVAHQEKSGLFLHLNTNKRSIVLDLKTPSDVQVVKELVKEADVVVENFRPGVMSSLGLDYGTLSNINPELVMTSISNFGQTGPYRDYAASELTLFAMGGPMNLIGLPELEPLRLGGNHVQYQAGNVAAMATLFAWYAQRYQALGGQHIDVSIFETQMGSINRRVPGLVQYQYTGERGIRLGGALQGYPSGYYPCQDGYMTITGGGNRWNRITEMLEMPELLEDPRFAPPLGQLSAEGKEEFESTIWIPWLLERTKQEAVDECQAHEILSAVVNSLEDVMQGNPQLSSRHFFVDADHPMAGTLSYPGAPFITEGAGWRIRKTAPLMGENNLDVRDSKWHPLTGESISREHVSDPRNNPLEGIRVIDMTMVWAGPYGTMFLADMGAEVIRVEPRNFIPMGSRGQMAHPDKEVEAKAPTSQFPNRDPGDHPWNRVAVFNAHARNKYSITADLTTPEGKDTFRRLVEVSDLFIENNSVGSMERLGFTYDVLSEWNPKLSMISSAGFGQTGPWRGHRGLGMQFEAAYGHASIIGYPNMDAEGVPISVVMDASNGVTIATAAVIALHQRAKTGKGMFIDMAMGETFLPHIGEMFMDFSMNGRVAGRLGNRHMSLVQGCYPCRGDDEWITISIGKIEEWHGLCNLMGRNDLIEDERFLDMEKLYTRHDEVDQIIGEWTIAKDPIALFHLLQNAGVIAGPVLHESHAYQDPHLRDRGFFVPITTVDTGTYVYPSTAFKMSKVPFQVRKPPVGLGEDNDYVYRQVLSLSTEEYNRLKDLGHIGTNYLPSVP